LREVAVEAIWRETYLCALGIAEQSLKGMGIDDDDAAQSIKVFREHDERLLRRQQAIYDDESLLIESARAAAQELEGLFDSDQRAKRHQDADSDAKPS
jgi:hypothetical protein